MKSIICKWRKIFRCPCPKCPFFQIEVANSNEDNTSGATKKFRCKKDGMSICDDILVGSGIVTGCPKFWTVPKLLFLSVATGSLMLLAGIWTAYFHLMFAQEKYCYLLDLNMNDLPEIRLFCLGMTLVLLPLIGLLYLDVKD